MVQTWKYTFDIDDSWQHLSILQCKATGQKRKEAKQRETADQGLRLCVDTEDGLLLLQKARFIYLLGSNIREHALIKITDGERNGDEGGERKRRDKRKRHYMKKVKWDTAKMKKTEKDNEWKEQSLNRFENLKDVWKTLMKGDKRRWIY